MQRTKTELRRDLQQARLKLSSEERQAKSAAIADRLRQAIDWSETRTLHYFEPMERLGEVDITDYIAALQANFPYLQFFTSREIDRKWQVVAFKSERFTAPMVLTNLPKFDVIIVPMLGFDDRLQRIGYGGGYYDCFLATQIQARKIGVCFDLGKLDKIPTEFHDIPLDIILTEGGVYASPTPG